MTQIPPPKTGPWSLAELKDVQKNGLTVVSTFSCGGGSSMGYKLAGFDVRAAVDIDPEMMRVYKQNFTPRYSFQMGVGDFARLPESDMPSDLYECDVLDGSPPCSVFSMSGKREDAWGVEKKFREGQVQQRLDDLFFQFIDVAKRLRPKLVLAENVKGLLAGNARGYVKEIFAAFNAIGYDVQLFLLNAALMGVPQRRERVFFIARRHDLNLTKFDLSFNERPISVRDAIEGCRVERAKPLTQRIASLYPFVKPGKSFSSVHPKGHMFNWIRLDMGRPSNTLASGAAEMVMHGDEARPLTVPEWVRLQTFPDDYDFTGTDGKYIIGMSVPPFMIQRVALKLAEKLTNELT